jgi:hypothetical protein
MLVSIRGKPNIYEIEGDKYKPVTEVNQDG